MLASGAGELYTCKDLCSVTRNQKVAIPAAQRVMGKVARAMQGTTLTPDQQKKAMRICTEAASELVKDGTVAKDPYFSELLNGQEALIEKTTARVKAEAL